jgi:MerR family transcriptional regulator, thiopeptide resistance regulator
VPATLPIAPIREEIASRFAARFGITVKALRVYEAAGLIAPSRTAKDWRVYGPVQAERLTVILALKSLGLSLKRIKAMLDGRGVDLGAVLHLQEDALAAQHRDLAVALGVVRAAREQLMAGAPLTPDDLANLVRSTTMTQQAWTPEMEAIAQKAYTPEQRAVLAAQSLTPEEEARVSASWAAIWADIDRLGISRATTPEGLDVGRRALAMIRQFTRGDAALWNAGGQFWKGVSEDPAASAQTGYDQARWAFMAAAFGELKARGELQA